MKEKNETYDELVGSPATHIDARSSILSDIALSREFAHVYLQALCRGFTGGTNEAGETTMVVDGVTVPLKMSLHTICQSLAKQRAICYGARGIKLKFSKFNLPVL